MPSRGWTSALAAATALLVLGAPSWAGAVPPHAQETDPPPEPTATSEPSEPSEPPSPEPAPPTSEPSPAPPAPAPSPTTEPPATTEPPPTTAPPATPGAPVTPAAPPREAGPGALTPFGTAAAPPPGASAPSPEGTPHDLDEATRAVAGAQAALAAARADLASAEGAAALAREQLAAARATDDEVRRRLAVAGHAEARAERRLAALRHRMEATRRDLGLVASQAYRGTDFATLSVVLDASTPAEFAERYVGMRTVLRAGDGVLGALAADGADLAQERSRLEAARELQVRLTRESEAAVAAAETAETAAREAEEHLASIVERRAEALAAAEDARLADYQQHQAFLAQSSAVGATILDWASRLAAGSGTVSGSGDFIRPGDGPVTSAFGPRLHPVLGYVKLHTGTDLGRGNGSVHAADAGTVVVAGSNTAYGLMTVIDHGDFGGRRLATLYAHQSAHFVREGDVVARGQRIGLIGSTGYSTGPHLHFEVRLDGQAVDPGPWIATAPPPAG